MDRMGNSTARAALIYLHRFAKGGQPKARVSLAPGAPAAFRA
jgi:hypothetical protein